MMQNQVNYFQYITDTSWTTNPYLVATAVTTFTTQRVCGQTNGLWLFPNSYLQLYNFNSYHLQNLGSSILLTNVRIIWPYQTQNYSLQLGFW